MDACRERIPVLSLSEDVVPYGTVISLATYYQVNETLSLQKSVGSRSRQTTSLSLREAKRRSNPKKEIASLRSQWQLKSYDGLQGIIKLKHTTPITPSGKITNNLQNEEASSRLWSIAAKAENPLSCRCEEPFGRLRVNSTMKQSDTKCHSELVSESKRLLRRVYTERSECARNDERRQRKAPKQGGCPTIKTEFIITAVKEINLLRGGIKTGIHWIV